MLLGIYLYKSYLFQILHITYLFILYNIHYIVNNFNFSYGICYCVNSVPN